MSTIFHKLWNRIPGDPKMKNMAFFIVTRSSVLGVVYYTTRNVPLLKNYSILAIIELVTVAVIVWRICLSIHRRLIQTPKRPLQYGKWAIITGSTAGIGEEFSSHLATEGMNLLIISRSADKLKQQQIKLLDNNKNISVRTIAHDFTDMSTDGRKAFYAKLNEECVLMDGDGGIGLLINNVGIANEYPKQLEEFSDEEVDSIINCNIFSTVYMTRIVMKYMKEKKNGCIISISSISGNHVGPYLQIYSSTKAFITQFSRSMQVEAWGTGVDFLVVTPYYIVSNLYKRKGGTLLAPMPDKLVTGTLSQLGKRYVWQGHGYWFHGVLGFFATYYWGMADRYRKMMIDNRKRYDLKVTSKEKGN